MSNRRLVGMKDVLDIVIRFGSNEIEIRLLFYWKKETVSGKSAKDTK